MNFQLNNQWHNAKAIVRLCEWGKRTTKYKTLITHMVKEEGPTMQKISSKFFWRRNTQKEKRSQFL